MSSDLLDCCEHNVGPNNGDCLKCAEPSRAEFAPCSRCSVEHRLITRDNVKVKMQPEHDCDANLAQSFDASGSASMSTLRLFKRSSSSVESIEPELSREWNVGSLLALGLGLGVSLG